MVFVLHGDVDRWKYAFDAKTHTEWPSDLSLLTNSSEEKERKTAKMMHDEMSKTKNCQLQQARGKKMGKPAHQEPDYWHPKRENI